MSMGRVAYARSCAADALDTLEHLTSESFSNGGDRSARENLVEALVMLGSDPDQWVRDYPQAVARATHAPSYGEIEPS